MSPRLPSGVVLCAVALGCAPDATRPAALDTAGGSCDSDADRAVFVLRTIDFSPSEGGVGVGFDLDQHVSELGDPEGCGKVDLVDPDGVPGIDSAFSALLPTLEQTEAVAVDGLLADAINSGELLITVELTGLDSLSDDACVTARVGPAEGTPLIGSDGLLLDGQSFERGDAALWSQPVEGAIEDGVLTMEGFDVSIAFQVITADLELDLRHAMLRASLDPETGLALGHFAGGFSTAQIGEELGDQGIDQAVKDLLINGLPLLADLKGEDGTCSDMSITFDFQAAPAFLLEP